jgi:hypothetical protein
MEPIVVNSSKVLPNRVQKDDPKNIKDISSFKDVEELFATFKKKRRYNLKVDYKRISHRSPNVLHTQGKDLEKLEAMIKMNIKQFSNKKDDESDLIIPERADTYRNIVKNSGLYSTKFIDVVIGGKRAGLDFVITHKEKYYAIKGGLEVDEFKGISNFIMHTEFEDAIRGGYKLFDCLQIDYGWKHRYFDQTPTYLLEK